MIHTENKAYTIKEGKVKARAASIPTLFISASDIESVRKLLKRETDETGLSGLLWITKTLPDAL